MFTLPTKTYTMPDGSRPMSKISRVDRRTAKVQKKANEDAAIVEAVKASKPARKPIGARLRAMVMERDGMACTRCGQVAGPGVTLHIDHIQPVASGGTNCESNLRTLCSECNLGRGARGEPPVVIEPPPPKPEVSPEDKALLAAKNAQTEALIKKVQKPKGDKT